MLARKQTEEKKKRVRELEEDLVLSDHTVEWETPKQTDWANVVIKEEEARVTRKKSKADKKKKDVSKTDQLLELLAQRNIEQVDRELGKRRGGSWHRKRKSNYILRSRKIASKCPTDPAPILFCLKSILKKWKREMCNENVVQGDYMVMLDIKPLQPLQSSSRAYEFFGITCKFRSGKERTFIWKYYFLASIGLSNFFMI